MNSRRAALTPTLEALQIGIPYVHPAIALPFTGHSLFPQCSSRDLQGARLLRRTFVEALGTPSVAHCCGPPIEEET